MKVRVLFFSRDGSGILFCFRKSPQITLRLTKQKRYSEQREIATNYISNSKSHNAVGQNTANLKFLTGQNYCHLKTLCLIYSLPKSCIPICCLSSDKSNSKTENRIHCLSFCCCYSNDRIHIRLPTKSFLRRNNPSGQRVCQWYIQCDCIRLGCRYIPIPDQDNF